MAATTLFSMLLFVAPVGSALAGVGSWSSTGPRGATIRAIGFQPSDPSRAWVGVGTRAAQSSGLLFKSVDGGLTWAPSNAGLPDVSIEAVAFDPASPSTLWVGTDGGGIFRSTDGGATWIARSEGLDVPFVRDIAIDPTAPSTLYAGTDQGVFKSTNAGASWQVVGDGLMLELVINDVALNPISPSIVYAATAEGIYRSANGGASWTVMANTDPRNMLSIAIDPVTPTTLYATDDEGNAWRIKQGGSWGTRNNGLGTDPGANFVALDPTNPSIAWLGESVGVFKATDAAGTINWVEISSGLPTGTNVGTLAVHPGGQAVIGGDTFGDGLYRTANAGASWARSNTGLVATDVGAVIVDPAAPRATGGAFAGTFFAGVFSTVDGGSSWARNQVARYVKILSLAIDPGTPSVRYAGLDFQNGVWKSTDSGATWAPTGFTTLPVRALAIDPVSRQTIYAATSNGIRKTIDGGATWAVANSGLTGLDVYALIAHPTAPGTLWAGTTAGVFATVDGAATWTPLSTGLTTTSVRALLLDAASSPTVLWVGTTGGVFRRASSEAAWSNASAGLATTDVRALAIDGQRTVYAGTYGGGVARRAQGDSSWSAMNAGLPVSRVTSLAWDKRAGGRLYAGTQGRGVQTIDIPQPACGDGTVQAGEQCDDGNESGGDCCSATCQFEPAGSSCANDGNACTSDVCNASGSCTHPAGPDGTACNDGSACTQTDACAAGVCIGSNPVTCTALDQCHVAGTCNPANGVCSNPNKPDGSACNDGSACTQTDACAAGTCTGSNPVVCSPSDSCHVAGTCSPSTGACSNPAKPDGSSCSDGNGCTVADACAGGSCVAGSPLVCTPSDGCHLAGVCNPSTGACSDPIAPDATSCDDGNACTEADACTAGTCGGVPVDGCVSVDAFACYKAKSARVTPSVPAFASRSVNVRDAWRSGLAPADLGVLLSKPAAVCNPSDLGGASGVASAKPGHAIAYSGRALESPFSSRLQSVRNQLGTLQLSVGRLAWVFTPTTVATWPTLASPLALTEPTPFSCYGASAARVAGNIFLRSQVTIADSLGGPLVYDLLKPAHLCIASTLDGSAPATPLGPATLACYQAKLARTNPAQPRFARTTDSTRNLFGSEALLLLTPLEICLPTELVN